MNKYEKLEWIHCAIQEAQNGNIGDLEQALGYVEDIRQDEMDKMNDDHHLNPERLQSQIDEHRDSLREDGINV